MDEQRIHQFRKELGERIRELRNAEGLSLRQFGNMIGVSYPYLSRVESGSVNVGIDVLLRIADGLGISVRDLFEA